MYTVCVEIVLFISEGIGVERGSWQVLLVDDDKNDYLKFQEYLALAKGGKFILDRAANAPDA